jgi:lysylphosphatidylglycerol synthetase-like protein (DUF2156 family)
MTGRRGEYRTVVVRALRLASQRLGAFYSFEVLRRFKGKFVPIWWESEWALGQRAMVMPTRVGLCDRPGRRARRCPFSC